MDPDAIHREPRPARLVDISDTKMFRLPRSRVQTALLWLMRAATLVLGGRVVLLCVGFFFAAPDVRRYQLESATVVFLVAGALLRVASARPANPARDRYDRHGSLFGESAGWCLASLLLYWPSLGVGLLSDDFVLVDRVGHHAFGLVQADLFRPLPLLAWGGIFALRGGPVALHAMNILAHGLVAFLACRLAAPLIASRLLSVGAGLLVLTFPAAVEAVTWTSGVFDVTATLLTITTILVSRRYGLRTRPLTRATLFVLAVAALLCKETAAVIPALIALDAWATRRRSRALLTDVVVLAVLFGGVGVGRLAFSSALVRQPLTRYTVQRWLFGTVADLVVPWHHELASLDPWLPLTGALLIVGLATMFFFTRSAQHRTRIAVAYGGFVLLGTLPTMSFFFVAPDLQGARYLYLPVVGYAVLLTVMVGAGTSVAARAFGTGVLVIIVLFGAVGSRWHQRYWQQAADIRDLVLATARADERLRACGTIAVDGLPDTERGAYIFRNGAAPALASAGLTLSAQPAASCAFSWDPARTEFTRLPAAP